MIIPHKMDKNITICPSLAFRPTTNFPAIFEMKIMPKRTASTTKKSEI
jgi:hypothetical protein